MLVMMFGEFFLHHIDHNLVKFLLHDVFFAFHA